LKNNCRPPSRWFSAGLRAVRAAFDGYTSEQHLDLRESGGRRHEQVAHSATYRHLAVTTGVDIRTLTGVPPANASRA